MLSTFLEEDKIIIKLDTRTYSEALTALVKKSVEADHETILAKILEREALMSTALGKGVALPRIHMQDKDKSEIIIGMIQHGIDTRGFDLIPIKIIVLFLFSPIDDHASILAESLRLFNDDTMRTELLQAPTSSDFIERVRTWEGV